MAGGWTWVVSTGDVRVGVTTSRRELTTSTVVVAGGAALLVDPSWDPDELCWIAADLAAAGIEVTAGFATHAHHDHVLWHPDLGDARRWAGPETVRLAARHRARLVANLGEEWPADLAELVGRLTPVDGDRLPWAGADAALITHDAHAAGHTAVWIGTVGVLLAGDMLSDVELPLLETSSAADYLAGLAALRPSVERAAVLVPGHGHPAVGGPAVRARWHADRRYVQSLLDRREVVDPRVGNPGMPAAHRANLARAALS